MKEIKGRNTSFICIIIASLFYIVNMGSFKLHLLFPMLIHTIFFCIASCSGYKKQSKAYNILCHMLYVFYIAAYVTMPDHKIKGEYYWLFGILKTNDTLFMVWHTVLWISIVLIIICLFITVKNIFTPPWWRKYTVLNLRGGRLIPISENGKDILRIEYDDGMKIYAGFSRKDNKYYITCAENNSGYKPSEIIAVFDKTDLPVEIQKAINKFRQRKA